jgi:hypothetical protein
LRTALEGLGINEVLTAPQSPWQDPYVERLIDSIRRECLDHVIVFGEAHLRRILAGYFDYQRRGGDFIAGLPNKLSARRGPLGSNPGLLLAE